MSTQYLTTLLKALLCHRELDGRPQSHAGLIVRLLAHTGLRIKEARKLRWKDVHEGFLLVPAEICKSSRPRMIPFVNGVAGVLDSLRKLAPGEETILPPAECKRSLRVACERAGLPTLSHHSFRHLFATRCIEGGVDLPTVARWLGHQEGGALLSKTYFHLLDEHSQRMAAKVKI